jgi:hypothetical protein
MGASLERIAQSQTAKAGPGENGWLILRKLTCQSLLANEYRNGFDRSRPDELFGDIVEAHPFCDFFLDQVQSSDIIYLEVVDCILHDFLSKTVQIRCFLPPPEHYSGYQLELTRNHQPY